MGGIRLIFVFFKWLYLSCNQLELLMMDETNHALPAVEYTRKSPSPDYIKPSLYTHAIAPITKEAGSYIDKHAFFCTIPKGKIFFKAGTVCPYIFMINKGMVRGFIKDGKKEITTWIAIETNMITSIGSFFNQLPSLENIHALEDCELTGLSYEHLQHMYQYFPEMNTVGRVLLEKYYQDADQRAVIGRLSNANIKYEHFMLANPQLINRIPLKYVASYLGITLETLSRLRNKRSQKRG